MHIGFVGLGNMGTTIANLVAGNGHPLTGWDHDRAVVEEIRTSRTNTKYLPGVAVHGALQATAELKDVFSGTEIVFIAVPSVFIRPTLEPVASSIPADTIIVNLAKGLDKETGETSFRTLSKLLPRNPVVMLSGPSIADEIARGKPTAVVLAGSDRSALYEVSDILENANFKTLLSDDETGVELGGILKTIYAIGLGIFDGCGIESVNFRSVYLTLALDEMASIGERLGAKRDSFFCLAGIGDLFATSLSSHSHIRRMGELLSSGKTLDEIRTEMGILPEGYNTLLAIKELSKKRKLKMPMADSLLQTINREIDPAGFVRSVLDAVYGCRGSCA